jgi:hypothetical protein
MGNQFECHTSGGEEKIELSIKSSMSFKPKGATRLTRSTDAFRGNGLRYGEHNEFALLQGLKRIRRLGIVLVLCFHD